MNIKKILFLHPNFPGQFRNIASELSSNGHIVKFLCMTHFGRKLKGVDRMCIKTENYNENEVDTSKWSEVSEKYRQALSQLKKRGWYPDVVISHSGWGCGMYVREVWPKTCIISYLEWWFNPESDNYKFDENNSYLGLTRKVAAKHWKRNLPISLELSCSDHIVAPTRWQRDQLPYILKEKCKIIYDGVNDQLFKPGQNKRGDVPTITYGTRGMEPMRAFPQFVISIPEILKLNDKLIVEIAGLDNINYGGYPPKNYKTWGRWAKEYLARNNAKSRVKWMGRLDLHSYIRWLQESWCHIYLTHPFVASWSFVEAQCCSWSLVASDVEPVREMKFHQKCYLVDHRKKGAIARGVKKSLEEINIFVDHNTPDKITDSSCFESWNSLING